MINDLKIAWIAALRSGEYKQTRNALKNDEGHCCLGVLCEVLAPHPSIKITADHIECTSAVGTAVWGILTSNIVREIGLDYGGGQAALITMNDTHEKDFNEIADWIEANL